MTDQERADMLIRIDQKLDDLKERFDKVSNGKGFPRCAEREVRLSRIETVQAWTTRSLFGGLIFLVFTQMLKFIGF